MSQKPEPNSSKHSWKVLDHILSYLKAMTSAPAVSDEERAEWEKLKNEFSTRSEDVKKAG